ncbi:hypothetical protein [Kocuria carniphila]|uniref:hypothetical protein n=1 Tax=Kocuria carniphila TaxID=262208 RepID=UPI000DB19516|nr:hypothetical protein [Kocuria carniphila]PZT86603.1 MAG: hypothetical protein DI630_34960 [Gordonia sp. (in: high G+C Gram-positive bacteria)]
MAHRKARDWAVTLGISTTIALTGCGTSTPASTASETQLTTAQDASATASQATSSPAQSENTQAASRGAKQTTGALTETYTSPDGSYSVKYPSSWQATTDKGYLELTSPDGSVTGHVSATGTYGPGEEWFTDRHLDHMTSYPAERLTELLGTTVGLYSGFKAGDSPEQDFVAHGLSQVNASGMVSLGKTDSKEELWASFEQTGVNTTGKGLTDAEAAKAAEKAVKSENGVTTQAILKSVEITPEASPEPPAQGEAEALTETYTAPDGRYSLKYPASWTAKTDKGYLELTSPSGEFTGRVATTDVRPATEEWFTTTRTMGDGGVESPITEQLGSQVSTYSAYVHSPESADKDLALYGLTQVNSSGMVSLLDGSGTGELWVEFTATPPTVTNQALSHEEAKEILNKVDTTFQDVPTVKAILQSIRLVDAAVSVG